MRSILTIRCFSAHFRQPAFPIFIIPCIVFLFQSTQANAQCGVPISTFPYHEDFEVSKGGWNSGGLSSDWAWGTPSKPTINTAGSGLKCWVTGGLTGSFYNLGERSFVESPCFDFTLLPHPYIHFKIWWESEQRYDGANLQYSLDNGFTWTNVGAVNDPVNCLNDNWYNYSPITNLNNLATPRDGWSGNIMPTVGNCQGGQGSNGWVIAKHCMTELAGKPMVRLRFTFGAGTTCNDFDGVAFDDIYIENAPPIGANFSSACSGNNTYAFTDLSTNCPDFWVWNFDDPASGGFNLSTFQNPSHVFSGPGVYNVTLQASNGCTAPSSITFPITVLGLNTSSTPANCNGGNDGTASVQINPVGGSPIYQWNTTPPQSVATAINLPAGSYSVTVSETGVCPVSTTVMVSEPAALQHSVNTQPASCGNQNGTANITQSGGTGPYTYQWSPNVSNSNSASNLSAGNYVVSVTDQHNCLDTAQITVNNIPGVVGMLGSVTPVNCFGGNDGAVTVSAVAGTPPYIYLWAPAGGNGSTASGLTAGSYTVTITDANLCTASITAIVNQAPVLQHSTQVANAGCSGTSGSATILESGGTGPYTYTWLPNVSNSNSASNLAAGNYLVSVRDQKNCLDTVQIQINSIAGVFGTLSQVSPVNCFGGNDGAVTITAGAGTPPYTYAWSPAGGNGPTVSGLSAGTYTVTITDANLCTATAVATITQAPMLQHSTQVTNASCAGADGAATVTATGGTGPYTYTWNPNVSNTNNANNLAAGNYLVSVIDQHNCLDTVHINVNNIAGLQGMVSQISPVSCFGGSDGMLTVTANAGTPPYTYGWTPIGGNGPTASGLPAGSYSVKITDANMCATNVTVALGQAPMLQHSSLVTGVSCMGTDGAVTIMQSGGTGPYTYQWTPNISNSNSASNLSVGNYVVSVTDQQNCVDTIHVNVSNIPNVFGTLGQVSAVNCFGGSDGMATVSANEGTPPYTYSWAQMGGNGPSASGLVAGTYTVIITDANMCTATTTAVVNQAPMLLHSAQVANAGCSGTSGSATILESGGTGPYTYTWLPNVSNSNSASNLAAGNYLVSVRDQKNCLDTVQIQINNIAGVFGTLSQVSPVSCFGGSDGAVTVTAGAGTPPYAYVWSAGGNAATASGLSAGTYTVTITDANLCTATTTATLNQAPILQHSTQVTNAGCAGADGSATITPSGGTGPYQFVWFPAVATGNQATGLTPGTYQVTIQDNKGCSDTAQILVGSDPGFQVQAQDLQVTQPSCYQGQDGAISVSTLGGNTPYSYLWSPIGGNGPSVSGLSAGSYTVIIKDALGCTDTLVINLQAPPPIQFWAAATAVLCPGDSDGSIQIDSTTGGTMPYRYSLGQSAFEPFTVFNGLQAGQYVVKAQDAEGCVVQDTLTVAGPMSNAIQAFSDTTIALGGIASLTGLLSDPGSVFSYHWEPGIYLSCDSCLNTLASPIKTTTYTLIAVDTNGCVISDALILRVLPGSVYIPNVIRPFSDNLNDYFTVYAGNGVEGVELMQIYDRWGSLIFERRNFQASEPQLGWDGTINGKEAATGVYVYVIKVKYINGLTVLYKGDLTVLR